MSLKQEESVTQIALISPHTILHSPTIIPQEMSAHELAHALKNPAPQAPFSNICDSQMVAIEQISDIFSKVADNLHQILDPPQQRLVTKSAIIPHKLCPTLTKTIPSEKPNIIEDDDGNSLTSFLRNGHMSPSGPHIILPDVPVPPLDVAQDAPLVVGQGRLGE